MENDKPSTKSRKLSPRKILSHTGIAVGAIILVCVVVLLLNPGPLVNRFVKPRITQAFTDAYPAYSIHIARMNYSIFTNRFGFDSVVVRAADGTFSGTMSSLSVGGISWMHFLWGGNPGTKDLASAVVDAHNVVLKFPQSQYEFRTERVRVAAADSELTATSIKYYCFIDDEQFFAKSRFRQTRFRFDVPATTMSGVDCLGLLEGKIYHARSITMHDVFADILVNMDKPYDSKSPNPQMPNEILSSMKELVKVNSVTVRNGRLKYSERYAVGAQPGVITFDKISLSATGIINHAPRPEAALIEGEGIFMNSGTMKLSIAIPLASKDFSLRYSGSLTAMDITALNTFLEAGEHRRIKSGILESATYDIDVHSGHASGTLRVAYKDLSIAVLNKDTGSERGVFDRISSFLGRVFVVRGSNMPDAKGSMKIGAIQYTRDPEDYFLQYVWFALRNGVADVIGFPKKIVPDHQ